jgi:hypothetical protein
MTSVSLCLALFFPCFCVAMRVCVCQMEASRACLTILIDCDMKLLDNTTFSRLGSALSGVHSHANIIAQLDAYSCKMAGADKRLYKQISNEGPVSELEILSSPGSFEVGSLGRSPNTLCNACSRKTLYYLKATLNAAYNPDYDFRSAPASDSGPSLRFV